MLQKFKANLVVRVTGDCPLVDPELVDKSIILIKKKNVDYVQILLSLRF